MNVPAAPSLVLHIGQHKTGSKALQAFLAYNRHVLHQSGLLYPVEDHSEHDILAYSRSQFRLFALIRHAAIGATIGRSAADAYWQTVAPYCRPFLTAWEFLATVEQERRRTDSHRILLSAEDLFDMHTAHEFAFFRPIAETGVRLLAEMISVIVGAARIVVYLRRQDHLLGAHYGQFIKGSITADLDLEAFAPAFAPRLDSSRLLSCWESAFGRERIVVRPYERQTMPEGIVGDFFAHGLGMPVPDETKAPPVDVESTNVSLGRDLIEYLRILNRRAAAGEDVPERGRVLHAALRSRPRLSGPGGIAAWLSPAQRRALLDCHAEGNARIARDYLNRQDGGLFTEPVPEDAPWTPYPGLSPSKAREITRAIPGSEHLEKPEGINRRRGLWRLLFGT